MNSFTKFGIGAAILVGLACVPASSVLAARHDDRGDGDRSHESHSAPSARPMGSHGGPPSGFHGSMPSRDFRGAPPGFHGTPRDFRGSASPSTHRDLRNDFRSNPSRDFRDRPSRDFRDRPSRDFHGAPSRDFRGGSGHEVHSTFRGHDFNHFTSQERETWRHGNWRHSWHNGHFGWWWFCDGFWFFYLEPIYPYPTYVGSDYYYDNNDYYDGGYGSDYYWYWCDDPEGYYPYVQECNDDWQPVSPTPPGSGYDNQGGYDGQGGYYGPDQ